MRLSDWDGIGMEDRELVGFVFVGQVVGRCLERQFINKWFWKLKNRLKLWEDKVLVKERLVDQWVEDFFWLGLLVWFRIFGEDLMDFCFQGS